jgi:hypothetical protein
MGLLVEGNDLGMGRSSYATSQVIAIDHVRKKPDVVPSEVELLGKLFE